LIVIANFFNRIRIWGEMFGLNLCKYTLFAGKSQWDCNQQKPSCTGRLLRIVLAEAISSFYGEYLIWIAKPY